MTDFKTELEKTGVLIYTNKGVSMMPLLRQDRDVMVIHHKTDNFKKNDAVLFIRDNGQYILHRIRKVLDNDKYYIIGDNCVRGEVVNKSQIIGILSKVKRDKKTVDLSDFSYKLYVLLVPIRRFFFLHFRFGMYVLRRIYHKLKRIVKNTLGY